MNFERTHDPAVDLLDPTIVLMEQRERELQEAYRLGLLHGINAQSMAQVKNDVMAFEDYGWSLEGGEGP